MTPEPRRSRRKASPPARLPSPASRSATGTTRISAPGSMPARWPTAWRIWISRSRRASRCGSSRTPGTLPCGPARGSEPAARRREPLHGVRGNGRQDREHRRPLRFLSWRFDPRLDRGLHAGSGHAAQPVGSHPVGRIGIPSPRRNGSRGRFGPPSGGGSAPHPRGRWGSRSLRETDSHAGRSIHRLLAGSVPAPTARATRRPGG